MVVQVDRREYFFLLVILHTEKQVYCRLFYVLVATNMRPSEQNNRS